MLITISRCLLAFAFGVWVSLTALPALSSRSAINRDLATDLARLACDSNVKLIICCLDDEELAFLGAPWEEYIYEAHRVGMSVWRCPMPEGLGPYIGGGEEDSESAEQERMMGMERVDKMIEDVIQRWTMKGFNVLTHCRGGVGRVSVFSSHSAF
jgi:protein-tyrosine phosphatase